MHFILVTTTQSLQQWLLTQMPLTAKKVPIYCGADSMVADGGFATVGVNYVQLGKQVADMVEKIANGRKSF